MVAQSASPLSSSPVGFNEASIAGIRDRIRFLVDYGVLAPGREPWVLSIGERAIDVRLAHQCALGPDAPAHRAMVVGCGLGLGLLRCALQALGCLESTILVPDPVQRDLLARVYIEGPGCIARDDLFRRALATTSIASSAIDRTLTGELAAHVGMERARLVLRSPGAARAVETSAPCCAPTFCDLAESHRWFVLAREEPEAGFATALCGSVETNGDGVRERLAAGQALARVALRARVDGLLTCIESPVSGTGGWQPQVTLRIRGLSETRSRAA